MTQAQMLKPMLRGHPFCAGLPPRYLAPLARCADALSFAAGQYLFREGTTSEAFFLLRDGAVSLETGGAFAVQTLGPGDVAGFSWLATPNRWEYDGRALEPVSALRLDGPRVLTECGKDPSLGYVLMRRFAALAADRLQASRLQVLEVYGGPHDR